MDITICIPTSNRSEIIATHKSLPERWKKFVRFYIPANQVKDYKKVLKGWTVVPVPSKLKYIGCQRQWIMDNRESQFVFFLDDDLSFSWRDEGLKLHKCDKLRMEDLLDYVEESLEAYPVVSISPRFGNNYCEKDEDENCRAHTAWAIDGELYDKLQIKFNPMGAVPFVMEDFHVTLCFLEKGHKNVRIFKFAFNPVLESNAEGGCSTWRTWEVHERVTQWMQDNHPSFTRVLKVSKTGWKGFPEVEGGRQRWDARIQWKKAFKPTIDKNSGISRFL